MGVRPRNRHRRSTSGSLITFRLLLLIDSTLPTPSTLCCGSPCAITLSGNRRYGAENQLSAYLEHTATPPQSQTQRLTRLEPSCDQNSAGTATWTAYVCMYV